MTHPFVIYDAMRAVNDDKAQVPLWPNAVAGTIKSLMLGQILLTSRVVTNATAKRVLEIADACRTGKPFVNYGVYSADGTPTPPHPNDWSYGPPNHTFGLCCIDIENQQQDFSPAAMDALFAPIAARYAVCMCAPEQLQGFDDGPLKDELWPRSGEIKYSPEWIAAKNWSRDNPWTRYVSYIECGGYFNSSANDDVLMTLYRNRIRLARAVFPQKQLIFTCWGTRETPGGGQIHTGLCADLVKMVGDEGVSALQVWGRPAECTNLRNVLGIG